MQNSSKEFLSGIVEKCWKGEEIASEEIEAFKKTIEDHEAKKTWVELLNKKRSCGAFQIAETNFNKVGELMNIVLSCIEEQEDLRLARQCIIYSQTFHNKDQEYLQGLVETHPLWQHVSVWEELVMLSIAQELEAYMQYSFSPEFDTPQDLSCKIRSIVVSQLMNYAHIMESFCLPKDKVSEMLKKIADDFRVTEEVESLFQE